MKFTKMQGCGNDYVYINCFEETVADPFTLAAEMSERHFGVGSDGIILVLPDDKADCRMRMFNFDGSEAEMCGNGIRCLGKYVYDRGIVKKDRLTVNTLAGIKELELHIKDGVVDTITVDMGEPMLEADKIPVVSDKSPVINMPVEVGGRKFEFTCVSMGNPHAVAFVDKTEGFDVEGFGSVAEVDKHFPRKANIEFAQVINEGYIKMRVWERGTGETLACGTGACATAVAAALNGLCGRSVKVGVIGGELSIEWSEDNNHVYLTGPARFSFDGNWLK